MAKPFESPALGDYVMEPTFPAGATRSDGWRIVRVRGAGSPDEEISRSADRLTTLAELRRLASEANAGAWVMDLDFRYSRV